MVVRGENLLLSATQGVGLSRVVGAAAGGGGGVGPGGSVEGGGGEVDGGPARGA